jgi:hypothetical protein
VSEERWVVLCEGSVIAERGSEEEAQDYADLGNLAWPPPEYAVFTVERVSS